MPGSMSGAGAGALKLIEEIRELKSQISELKEKMAGSILWENPDPTKAFVAQTITLSSAEYDYFDIMFKGSSGDSIMITHRGYKGYNMQIDRVGTTGRPTRTISYISDTQYAISKCTIYDFTNGTSADNNSNNIPVKIIGYKL